MPGTKLFAVPSPTLIYLILQSPPMAEIPQHTHCITCGRAIPLGEKFCSEECERAHKETIRKKKNQLLVLYLVAIIVMLLALFSGIL